jgi:hypothetical protein
MLPLEERVKELEEEVARIKATLKQQAVSVVPWTKQIAGTFADDPLYDEAMRLGRRYRESTRPKAMKRKKGANGHS